MLYNLNNQTLIRIVQFLFDLFAFASYPIGVAWLSVPVAVFLENTY